MNPQNLHQRDIAVAQLGLQLSRGDPRLSGEEPSDEELSAFLDGRLGQARRLQIMAYIAHRDDVYTRWLRCIEANRIARAPSVEIAAKETTVAKGSPTIRTLLGWMKSLSPGSNHGWAGAAWVTAVAAVFVVALLPSVVADDYGGQIDEIYEQYGVEIAQVWPRVGHVRHPATIAQQRSFFSPAKDAARLTLAAGFKNGARALGAEKYRAIGIDIDRLDDQRATTLAGSDARYKDLYELGRITAFATLQCQIGPSGVALDRSGNVMRGLLRPLLAMPHDDIVRLVDISRTALGDAPSACQMAHTVVEMIAS